MPASTGRSPAGIPSVFHGIRTPAAAAIVGSASTVRTAPSSTRPARWPGTLTMNGTTAMSGRVASVTRRRGSPARKDTPWSAVTRITASS